MKIGQFAKKYDVSIDTVRYYMELELLVPEKSGGQYEFDENCANSLEEILWLKSAEFSLNEIQRIFSLKRMTSLKSDEDMEYYKTLFMNKKGELLFRREEIDRILVRINEKITGISQGYERPDIRLGVPINSLHILSCPKCKGGLSLRKASVEDNIILNGELGCSCGFKAVIEEGIIVMQNDFEKLHLMKEYLDIKERLKEDELESHFIEQTSSDFINLIYRSNQWIINRLDFNMGGSKVLLELGTGSGIFLSKILGLLPENYLYIAVDHNYEKLLETKGSIEKHYEKGDFIFICCDFLEMPVKDESVDILLDHFGTTNYNLYKEGFLIDKLQDKVKLHGKWFGGYNSFKPNARSLKMYPEKNRKYFYLENIINSLENSKFKTIEMKDMGFTEKGGIYEKFFIEGDRLYDFVYYGEKVE